MIFPLGTENDFKVWSSNFLSQFKKREDKSSERDCQCSGESQSADKACCENQTDPVNNGTQEDEVWHIYCRLRKEWYKNLNVTLAYVKSLLESVCKGLI